MILRGLDSSGSIATYMWDVSPQQDYPMASILRFPKLFTGHHLWHRGDQGRQCVH